MYTLSSKLKTFSLILMVIGILGIGYGFLTAPKTIEDVEAILAADSHGGGHGDAHAAQPEHKIQDDTKVDAASKHVTGGAVHAEAEGIHDATAVGLNEQTGAPAAADSAGIKTVNADVEDSDTAHAANVNATQDVSQTEMHHMTVPAEAHDQAANDKQSAADAHAEHQEHLEHVLHQLQNKPWAAVYVACIFFMLISLGVLAFYAIQIVAQAGWSPVLFRVMQGLSAYLLPGSIIFFILLLASAFHFNHLFVWMAEGVTEIGHKNYDKLIANKSGYLNETFWLIRAAVFLIGWNLYRFYTRKHCLAQDENSDNQSYKTNFKLSAAFLVFFIVTESIMSWDWIMSVDPHWFSTLFGWYVFASFFVSGITMICLVTLYMKSKGYLEYVNTSHIHDLAKFMFGISVFWTYLWFSQFMLIWYANIPEEVTYFVQRIEQYNLPFFGAVVMNFVFPILILVNTDFKRITWVLVMAGVVILLGHYIDFFNMIMPATVGDQWFIGIPEIGSLLFFGGLFIFVVFSAMTKSPLLPKRNPFIEESKHFHY